MKINSLNINGVKIFKPTDV